jgi:alkylhydroperoxidase family enzyme
MTWLPVTVDQGSDRDSVLGLFPEQYANLRELHESAWAMNDAELLELCWLRMAQLLDCRRALEAEAAERLAELDDWQASDAFTPVQRAALAYVDQFVLDPNSVTQELNDELADLLSLRGLFELIAAVSTLEVCLRLCTLLDLDPRFPRGEPRVAAEAAAQDEAVPRADGIGLRDYYKSVIDRRFAQARITYGASVVRLSGVDPLTTESVRLRNATFQQCLY